MEKLLEGALIKLSSVASKLTTESAKDMIKAMIAGERDPRTLAALARTRMKAKHDELAGALDGMFDDHHGELARMLLDQIAFLDERATQLTARITAAVAAMPAAWGVDGDGTAGPDAGTGPDAAVLPAVQRLAEIPGISPGLARAIIAETGLDMSRFPTAAHLVSWAGLCPSARQSGPRTRAGKKGQGNTWLRGSLGQAAIGAARTDTFPGERYWRIARRRGKAKAQVRRPVHPGDHLAPARRSRRPVHRPRRRLLPGPHRQGQEDQKPHPADRGAARPPHHHHAEGRVTLYRL
jgi:transposase